MASATRAMMPALLGVLAVSRALAQDGGGERRDVEGIVVLKGPAPPPSAAFVALDVEACGAKKARADLVVSKKGGVRDALVVVDTAPAESASGPPAEGPVLDRRRCEFVPHAVAVNAGTRVTFANADPVSHAVHVFDPAAPFDRPLARGETVERTFDRPGAWLVKCDYHHWESAVVFVVPRRRFALTDAYGRFRIADVATGKQRLRIRHEILGTWDEEIQVPAKAPARIELSLPKR